MSLLNQKNGVIGVFDSGVGGLSVLKELHKSLFNEDFIYVSDNAHCPYGPKSIEEVQSRAFKITDFLLSKGAKIIVVACNTATAAAIDELRQNFNNVIFVGMEPAVKPAALHSKSGVIGVLATKGTFKGRLYHRTLERFASDIEVVEQVGEGLVEIVEEGKFDEMATYELLKKYITPMIDKGADHIVLGCTHYPFLKEQIQEVVGQNIVVVDPAPSVALRVKSVLEERGLLSISKENRLNCSTEYISTGDTSNLKRMVSLIDPYFKESCIKSIQI